MYYSFDLSIHAERANQMLNDPELQLISLKFSIHKEHAMVLANMRFKRCERRKRKYRRYLQRLFMAGETNDGRINQILNDPKYSLIRMETTDYENGTMVVLDYKEKIGR